MRPIRNIIIAISILAIAGLALNIILGANTVSYLTYHEYPVKHYIFDFSNYITTINTNIQKFTDIKLDMPDFIISSSNDYITVVVNGFIMIINILLFPIRYGAYVGNIILSIIGINMLNPPESIKWLVDFINSGITLTIAYI